MSANTQPLRQIIIRRFAVRVIACICNRSGQHMLLLAGCLGIATGLAGCRSGQTIQVPAVLPARMLPKTNASVKKVVRLRGIVYNKRDSTSAIPGVEMVFSPVLPNSLAQVRRDVTKPDGAYSVDLLAGSSYTIETSKDFKVVEIQQITVPANAADTSIVSRNFYINYVDITEGGGIREPGPMIWFDTNKATLRAWSKTTLDNIVRIANTNPSIGVIVEGYAEPMELPQHQTRRTYYLNQLSQQRADAACAHLVERGIKAKRLYTVSHGTRGLGVPNTSPEYRQLNRRVELYALPNNDVEKLRAHGAIPYQPLSKPKASHLTQKKPLKKQVLN